MKKRANEKERITAYRRAGRSYTEISVLMGGLPLSTIERYVSRIRKKPISSLTVALEKGSTTSALPGRSGAKSDFDSFLDAQLKTARFTDALN